MEKKLTNNVRFYTFIEVMSKYSDENISLSTAEINQHMKNLIGVELDRRSIYRYIKDMQDIGFDISSYDGESGGYKLIGHRLEEFEIKILIDAVVASRFITRKKSKELVEKLSNLNSIYIYKDLKRDIFIDDRSKSINEEIFINIDRINYAIKHGNQISFNYFDYNYNKQLTPRFNKDGSLKDYRVTPISMILKNENYYLILADQKHNDLSNYRIDRMKNIKVLDEEKRDLTLIDDCRKSFNVATYSKKCFKMFAGEESDVVIRFNSNLLNFMIDEFGEDIEISNNNDNTYNGRFIAKVGKGLARWIFQLGNDAKVLYPNSLKEEVKKELMEMVELY